LNTVFEVLTYNILPIFVVAGLGFWLRRYFLVDKQTVSSIVFYALSPCLVFSSLINSALPVAELGQLAGFTVIFVLALGGLTLVAGRLLRLDRRDTVTLMLVVMFVNSANYGITFNQLRYGDEGVTRAIVYYFTSTVLIFTLGIFIASMGQMDARTALRNLLRLPPLYAVAFALLIYGFQVALPSPLLRAVDIAGAGAIPVMLLLLGMQMADMPGWGGMGFIVPAVALRMVVGPLVGFGLALLIGLDHLGLAVSVAQAGMPTAVMVIILDTQYDLRPAEVTGTVVITTLASVISLPLVIYFFGL
jgi:malate permease and related proteins